MPDSWDFNQRPASSDAKTPVPILTYMLCSICVLITLAYHTAGDTPGTFWYQLGHFGYPDSTAIWNGRYYLLFTSVFLHGSIMHIVFNLLWLARLGRVLESTLNPFIYILFFVAATLLSSCAELGVMGNCGIGASGAVYAMFGLLWAGRGQFPEWGAVATRNNLNTFLVWGAICIVTTLTHIMNIGNAAHGGGLLFGLAIGYLCYAPRRQPLWAIPLALLGILTVLSVTWLPWSWEWNFWKGNQGFDQRNYRSAIAYYQRSLKLDPEDPEAWDNIGRAWQNIAAQEEQRNNPEGVKQAQAEQAKAEAQAARLDQEAQRQEQQAAQKSPKSVPDVNDLLQGAPGSSGNPTH